MSNKAQRDGTELTATGPGGTFDIRPYWNDDDGDEIHSFDLFSSQRRIPSPRGYAVYLRNYSPSTGIGVHYHVENFANLMDATIKAEESAGRDGA